MKIILIMCVVLLSFTLPAKEVYPDETEYEEIPVKKQRAKKEKKNGYQNS